MYSKWPYGSHKKQTTTKNRRPQMLKRGKKYYKKKWLLIFCLRDMFVGYWMKTTLLTMNVLTFFSSSLYGYMQILGLLVSVFLPVCSCTLKDRFLDLFDCWFIIHLVDHNKLTKHMLLGSKHCWVTDQCMIHKTTLQFMQW